MDNYRYVIQERNELDGLWFETDRTDPHCRENVEKVTHRFLWWTREATVTLRAYTGQSTLRSQARELAEARRRKCVGPVRIATLIEYVEYGSGDTKEHVGDVIWRDGQWL